MRLSKRPVPQDSRRYAARATRRRLRFRPPAHPGRIVACVVGAAAVIALALVWGSYLKTKSDAYRAAEEAGAWTLSETVSPVRPVTVPAYRAASILPGHNTGDIVLGGKHEGILLPLVAPDGTLRVGLSLAEAAGLSTEPDAPAAVDEVARISRRSLYVVGLFPVTHHHESDLSLSTYRRGLEMGLLLELAEAGFDELLLVGLPCGDEASDRMAISFVEDLKAALATLPDAPAVGVVLPLAAFEGGDTGETDTNGDSLPLYTGNPTPARLLSAADYAVADLRGKTATETDGLLPRFSYAYSRYDLRLLCDADGDAVDEALSHGFDRVYECMPEAATPTT